MATTAAPNAFASKLNRSRLERLKIVKIGYFKHRLTVRNFNAVILTKRNK
jgi:hypothetical protein